MTSAPTGVPAIRTFLIADVRGYTAFTQQHGDEAAARLAGRFAEIAQEGVEACGGELLELRGDEALCVFMSARKALRAATELAEAFSEATVDDPTLPLGVGFGLDAGEAVAVAGGYRGGALNLAARLCSKAGPGEVLASEGVIHLASTIEGMSYEPTEPFEMKGISEPVRAARVQPARTRTTTGSRKSDHPANADLPPELDLVSPFVGRQRELRWLRWSWRRARHGHGGAVFVIGAPGMGRTRLTAELARAASQDGATVTYIGCAAPTDGVIRRLEEAASTEGPALTIVDDLSDKIERGREALELLLEQAQGQDRLVVATCEEPMARWVKDLTEQVDPDGHARRRLEPLSAQEVVELATLYAGVTPADLPLSDLMEDTGGSPELLHAYVIDWAVGHVADRLNASATRAGAQRSGLRAAEADLAVTVAEIELARERARIHGMEAGRTADGAPRPATMCPFKGLATFDPSDADLFFGREQLIAEMVARSVGARFLGVVGPSGSGKSSAVRAGLMPALASGALPGSEAWSQRLIRPGPHPMAELGRAASEGGRSILVIDQFEETFTACSDEDERAAFVQAITTDADDTVVIAAVRADFYGRCAGYPSLARLFGMTHVLVGPMDERELRRAIELPARRAGLRVEPSLVEALVDEVADEPGGLPLLSTTLLELWQRRDGRMLTMERYRETGGVRAAVARLAEDAYARLSPQQQIVARAILLRLAGTEIGDAAMGRRVPLGELDVDHDPDAAEVLTVLADARMLTVSEGSVEVAHDALLREWPRLRGWLEEDVEGRRLHHHLMEAAREWTAGGEDPADLYRGARLASAMDWTAQHTVELNEQERAFLEQSREASRAEIDRTRRMNRRLKGSLVGVAVFLVVALVGASLALQQRAHARAIATVAESKRLAAQAIDETDPGRSVQLALAGLSLDDSLDTRSALLQVLQQNPSAIGLIPTSGGLEGVAVAPDGRTVVADLGGSLAFFDTASRAMVGTPVPVLDDGFPNELASDPSGRTVAVAGVTGGVTYVGLVDARDHHVIPAWSVGRQTAAMSLAFSPNGKQLAVAAADLNSASLTPTTDRYIAFIDPHTGGDPRSYIGVGTFNTETEAGSTDSRHFTSVAYLRDGALAVSWFDGGTTIWDPSSGRRLKHFDVGGAAVAASSDGRTLAVGQLNGDVALIDVRTGAVRRMDGHHAGPVTGAVFTRDGRRVITSGIDGQIKLWDVATSRLLATFSGSGLAVSPDGNTLYSSSSGSAIAVWDLSGTRGLTSSADIGAGDPRFGIGGAGLVAFQLPGGPPEHATEIGLWDTATGATSSIPALPGQTCSASVSPDGSRLLESCDGGYGTKEQTDRNVAIWDVSSRSQIGSTMRSSGGATWDGAFSPDGSTFATASDDLFPVGTAGAARTSTVIVRDAASMQTVWSYHLTGSASSGGGVVFSPDGRLIAAATDSDTRIWDTSTRLLVASPEVQDQIPVKSMAFSPDGRTLALALATGAVRFLDTLTWTDAAPPIAAAADSIAYSPDGTYLAIADAGEVSLWDVASGRRVGSGFMGSPDHQYGTMGFLPDGGIVLLITNEPAFIYRADLPSWRAQACSIVGDVTPAEWQEIAPNEPYRSTCSA